MLLCPWDSPGKNSEVGSHSLLQGIFTIQILNPGLPHCRQILYHMNHLGSPSKSHPNFFKTSLSAFSERWGLLVFPDVCLLVPGGCPLLFLVNSKDVSPWRGHFAFILQNLYLNIGIKYAMARDTGFLQKTSGTVYVRNSLKCAGCMGDKGCKFQIISSQQLLLETPN